MQLFTGEAIEIQYGWYGVVIVYLRTTESLAGLALYGVKCKLMQFNL